MPVSYFHFYPQTFLGLGCTFSIFSIIRLFINSFIILLSDSMSCERSISPPRPAGCNNGFVWRDYLGVCVCVMEAGFLVFF